MDPELKKSKDMLRSTVEKRRNEGRNILILDMMSYGEVLRDLNTAGCAMGLIDKRRRKHKQEDAMKNIRFVEGDLFRLEDWLHVKQYLEAQGRENFDFIFCRPLGAISLHMHENRLSYDWLFSQVLPLLNPNGGIFLAQIHPKMVEYVEEMGKVLNLLPGIEVKTFQEKLGNRTIDATCIIKRTQGEETSRLL